MSLIFAGSRAEFSLHLKAFDCVFEPHDLMPKKSVVAKYLKANAHYSVWDSYASMRLIAALNRATGESGFLIQIRSYFDERISINGAIVDNSYFTEPVPQYGVFPTALVAGELSAEDLTNLLTYSLSEPDTYSELFYMTAIAFLAEDSSWAAYAHIDQDFVLFYNDKHKCIVERFGKDIEDFD